MKRIIASVIVLFIALAAGGSALGRAPEPAQPQQHSGHSRYCADSLAQEGGPGHTSHSHAELLDEKDIYKHVAYGRDCQKIEGRFGISHSRKDPSSDVIGKDE